MSARSFLHQSSPVGRMFQRVLRGASGWHWREVGVLFFFLLLTLFFTYPLGFHLADGVVQPAEDPQLNRWILAWDTHALLTDPIRLFEGNIFYPYPIALAYSENLLASALLLLPLQLLWNNPTAVYGTLFIATFVLSGLGAYLLGWQVSGSRWAGLIAGVIFAFCPYKMSQIHHVQNLSAHWMPFAFLALQRVVAGGRRRDFVLLAIFTLLQALSSVYYALFLAVGLVLVGGSFCLLRLWGKWRLVLGWLARLALTGLLVAGLALPVFLPYARLVQLMDAGRSLSYVTGLSPDAQNYLAAPASNWLYGRLTAGLRKEPEGSLLPGLMAIALALTGLIIGLRRPACRPWSLSLLVLIVGAGVFSLGPTIHLAGRVLGRGPYILLYRYVPGFSGVRVPGRFAVLVMLGLATLAALGAGWVVRRVKGGRQRVLSLALIGLIAVEYASLPWPVQSIETGESVSAVYRWLAGQPGDFALVELPIDQYPASEHNILYMGQSVHHWKRLVNGYSGFFPTSHLALVDLLQGFPDPASIHALRLLGVRYVLVHRDMLPAEKATQFHASLVREHEGLTWAGVLGQTWVYRVNEPPAGDQLDLGTPLARPFLLKGWSHRGDLGAAGPFIWAEADVTMLLPLGARRANIHAESPYGAQRCSLSLNDSRLGEAFFPSGQMVNYPISLPVSTRSAPPVLRWWCAGPSAPAHSMQIGTTGREAPVDLAIRVAGREGGDYVDLYLAGKRYSVDATCGTCAGLLIVPAGQPTAARWEQLDLGKPAQVEAFGRLMDSLPEGTVILLGLRAGVSLSPAWRLSLMRLGAQGERFPGAGEAYLLMGVIGAPAGTALEMTCRGSCWEYVGRPWPDYRLAVSRLEWQP